MPAQQGYETVGGRDDSLEVYPQEEQDDDTNHRRLRGLLRLFGRTIRYLKGIIFQTTWEVCRTDKSRISDTSHRARTTSVQVSRTTENTLKATSSSKHTRKSNLPVLLPKTACYIRVSVLDRASGTCVLSKCCRMALIYSESGKMKDVEEYEDPVGREHHQALYFRRNSGLQAVHSMRIPTISPPALGHWCCTDISERIL